MKNQLKNHINQIKKTIALYLSTNKLFLFYVILSLIGTIIMRQFTVGSPFNLKPLLVDLSIIIIIGSVGYIIKCSKRYKYYLTWLIIFTLAEIINHIYYIFYTSFASFGELAGLSQAETITGSILEKLSLLNFIYLLFPLIFILIHKKLFNSSYYNIVSKIQKSKKMFITTALFGMLCLVYCLSTATKTDYSRLAKQWNRGAIVERFGIILYQGNDLIQTLRPKISSLFGYEESATLFKEFFTTNEKKYNQKNKYTNVLENYNIVFIHMESIGKFLMDLSFNGIEVTPTINQLAKEGMFFNNFYPQVSSGTSSDTEFTLLTSLFPVSTGIVFTSYYNRNYETIPKLLQEKNYYTFSMHGNYASMWNREKVHPNLGYQKMYFRESFDIPDKESPDYINLGISDREFYRQLLPKLEQIEQENEHYMGTLITLSNHSPFVFLDKYGEFDLSTHITKEDGTVESIDYLSETAVGKYIKSAHYADIALGEFMNTIKESSYFNNTVFVLYGDHDAKLTRNELNQLYNMNLETGELYTNEHAEYIDYNSYEHDLNKKTPLIIWSKNKNIQNKIKGTITYPMGMIDIMPTLGNMLGIKNDFALGHDIFNIKNDNIIVFPNGNFLTNNLYYNNSNEKYYITKVGAVIEQDYIDECKKYVDKRLEVSNAIIIHDLIYNEGPTLYNTEINGSKKEEKNE